MQPSPTKTFARLRKLLLRGAGLLALLYLALLIPGPTPVISGGAGKAPFAWKQDPLWAELESRFRESRAAGCPALAGQINQALQEGSRLLDGISGKTLEPDAGEFRVLESNVFQLAPLVAVCPQHLPDYAALIFRTRAELKRQSRQWDMNSAPARQRIYRLLFGGRIALEEAMLQSPSGTSALELALCTDEPSRTPAVSVLGLPLHSGDILVSRGGAPTSALIARGNDYPGNFSHVALLHVDEKTGRASVVESHIEKGVAVASMDEYLQDKKLRIMALRLRADLPALMADPLLPHTAAAAGLAEAKRRHIPYDFAMDSRNHDALFCSEVAAAAYEQAGVRLWMGVSFISSPVVTAWLGSLGVRHFETQEPADLEYDPQLCVVAEWRDRTALFKAHVDDAVTDAMLEEAGPGKPLDYPVPWLPLSRLAKAWSVVLNAVGKVGPIPEGMSATAALRVKKYRADHNALADRLLTVAEDFKKERGYVPPYWELLSLARQAIRNQES